MTNRYIKLPELNMRLEEMGLESDSGYGLTLMGNLVKGDAYGFICYDIADLLEPKNAKKLWGEERYVEVEFGDTDLWYGGNGNCDGVEFDGQMWQYKTHLLLERYQSGKDWESWLEEGLKVD